MPQYLLFTLLLLLSAPGRGANYTLQDLEALSADGAHEEFFQHALDIRPSERLGPWREMMSKMGVLLTKSLQAKTLLKRQDFNKIESLYTLPVLREDDSFKVRRQELGLRYLEKCLKSANPCNDDLKAFWEKDPTDPELAVKLAEIIHALPNSPLPLWTFLDVALKSPLSEFFCKKPFVMKSLWDKFEVDYIRLGVQGDLLKKIDSTVHPDCLPSLNKEAITRLHSPQKTMDRELGFQILKAQNKVNASMSDFFYTVYLLEKPSQGELFNYAWGRLKELGNASIRRDEVMKQLKKLDPLPDDIFSSMDQTKKRVILGHFKNNFPEYLDFYASECVQYYGGKVSYPHGNPTIHCQELMASDLAPQFIDAYKLKQYQDVKKI